VERRQRKFWGWGYEGDGPNANQRKAIAEAFAARFNTGPLAIVEPPRLEEIELRRPRLSPHSHGE